ncbi:zinc-binding dehydrogenase [Microbacterium album]|uniref:Succinate-semialdehyde dehydrogenase n=1 Tax=Microbacterium album TaxID=2053191 RepID=A0A917IDD8_9MICO|nr:zinc-binding dehydrogenase [Microbacterium album]GGH38100.1 succinate-semialdehyde dehydrogenase [Microbacterium album]
MPVPPIMRAAVLVTDEPRLQVMEIPTPVPRAGEVLVRVIACGVCHTDLHVIKGEVAFPRPAVVGHEVSGVVVALGGGLDASGLAVGDVVVSGFIMPCTTCDACRRGRDDLCANFFAHNRLRGTLYDGESRLAMPDGSFLAMYSMGGLAEYCVIPAAAVTPLPAGLNEQNAAILGCAGLTAYGATFRQAALSPGARVAIVGVGGIGSSLIPMARAAGAAQIIAVDIADEKLDRARELGATDTVNGRALDAVAEVRSLSGAGVDVAFEALGNPATFRQAVDMLADGGRMVAIGIAAGRAEAAVEITPLVRRGYEIVGSFGGRTRTDLPEVARLAADGTFRTDELITRRYGLDDADQAYRDLARGAITGRALITMQGAAS